MRDLFFVAFLIALLGLGFRRPFLFVLAYAYVDIVSPQQLSYFLLNRLPLSLIISGLAFAGWLFTDQQKRLSFAPRQFLMVALLVYAGTTTLHADFPVDAAAKWSWVWKSMIWAIFLPLFLRTRLRIEAYLLFMTLGLGTIIIVGGIKTIVTGGGYGELNLMVANNTGLFEGSIISTAAIAIIPIILWLSRFGTIFPPDWRVRAFAYALIFSCMLIPVGTQARTGLMCIGVFVVLALRDAKRRILYICLMAAAGLVAIPFLPSAFSSRMETISGYQADSSATARLAVWQWTWNYVQDHPMGGGFDSFRGNKLQVLVTQKTDSGATETVSQQVMIDEGRAFHSSYFEMLGEQGFPGLIAFLILQFGGLIRMEVMRRRYWKAEGEDAWISPLATALQIAQVIYLVGSLFVGIAYQSTFVSLLGVQIGFDSYLANKRREAAKSSWSKKEPAAAAA
ncbi:MAG: putative O-glycosylation ligase, exosortase system-associated [Alphaproteobacteria bacterium]|nr:putative O-glycosylation ligase, exosortase system-associated [Alphaproteobacteria bacterium]MDB5720230.1 putative O-glycosylation ligase, exosortase system-associated [Alphaproteobacteria bacterium]